MTHRYVIIGPADKTSTLNQLAADLDPDEGGALTFGDVELSADGTDPATHTMCNTLMSGEVWSQAEGYLDSLDFPVSIYRVKGQGIHPSTVYRYDSGAWVSVGTGRVAGQALEDMALQRITTEVL